MSKKSKHPLPRRRRPERGSAAAVSWLFYEQMDEAEDLVRAGRWSEVVELARDLDRRFPRRMEVLTLLAEACHRTHELAAYQEVCERLVKLAPDEPEFQLAYAGACLLNHRPALAMRAFRQFLKTHPHDRRAADVRKTLADLEPGFRTLMSEIGPPGPETENIAGMHEEVQCLLHTGEFARCIEAARRLLQRRPDFVPTLNNMSLAQFHSGQAEAAIASAQRVLEIDPHNYHALSNVCKFTFLSGRPDAAQTYAERLLRVESPRTDIWLKKAEALSFLGNDAAILEILADFDRDPRECLPHEEAMLCHFAAVSAWRLGREAVARRLWKRALALSPEFGFAKENLADLAKPVSQRHAPWPSDLNSWISFRTINYLKEFSADRARVENESSNPEEFRRFLERHPEFNTLVPALLDRGDPVGREFACWFAAMAQTPELLEALRSFALSSRGPDKTRMEAIQTLKKAGAVPEGPVRMWIEGEWREVELFCQEITDEPVIRHTPHVEELGRRAIDALHKKDPQTAERLLREALQAEPDAPDLVQNLAACYEMQGRSDAAHQLIRENHARHPDYFSGRVAMAQLCRREGRLEEATDMLRSLIQTKQLHSSELQALSLAQIDLSLDKHDTKTADTWLKMLETSDPDCRHLATQRRRIGFAKLADNVKKLIPGRSKKD